MSISVPPFGTDAKIVVSVLVATVLARSAVPKLRDLRGFTLVVVGYRVLPASTALRIGPFIPLLELAIALCLYMGLIVPAVATAASLMFLSFGLAITVNLLRGRELDCGCFGRRSRRKISYHLVMLDIFLAGAAGTSALVSRDQPLLESWSIFLLLPSQYRSGAVLLVLVLSFLAILLATRFRSRAPREQGTWRLSATTTERTGSE